MRTEFYKLIKNTFLFAFAITLISILSGVFLKDFICDFYIDISYDIRLGVDLIHSLNFGYVIFFGAVIPIIFSLVMFIFRHELSIGSIKRLRLAFYNIFLGSLILLILSLYIELYTLLCLIDNTSTPLEVIDSDAFGGYFILKFIIKTFAHLFIGIGITWSILQLWQTVRKEVKTK